MPPPRTRTGPRYCRCGTRLAADNPGDRCQPCVRRDQDHERHPPDLPPGFWHTDQLRDAFAAQHLGLVSVAYRRHPFHQRPITQDRLGSWLGITQAQVSRIESGPPVRNLDQLIFWARTMKIPPELLWFAMPGARRRPSGTVGIGSGGTPGAGTTVPQPNGTAPDGAPQEVVLPADAASLDRQMAAAGPAAASSSRHRAPAETGAASPAPHPAAAGPDGRSSAAFSPALSPGAPYGPSGAAQGRSFDVPARPDQANHQVDRDSGLVIQNQLAAVLDAGGALSATGLPELLAGIGSRAPSSPVPIGSPSPGGTAPSLPTSTLSDLHATMPDGPSLGVAGGQGQVIGRIGEVLLVTIDRRVFIVNMGRASGLALPALVTETARQGLARDLLGDGYASADEWKAIVHEYCTTLGVPPAEKFVRLSTDLAGLGDALKHERSESGRSELRKAGAILTRIMSSTVASLGDLAGCLRWARTARQIADASGDLHTRIWVRGAEVVMGLYQQRPVDDLLRIAEEAVALGQAQGSLRTFAWPKLLGATAQVLAVTGRRAEAKTLLQRTRDSFSALPGNPQDGSSLPLLSYSERNLYYAESYVYTYLDEYDRAEAAQDAVLRLYAPEDHRNPAQIELMRALCQVRAGDTTAGVAHARETVGRLPQAHRIHTVIDLGRKVVEAVPVEERQDDEVVGLRELVGGGT